MVCVRLGTEQKKKRENDIELNCRWWQKYQQHKLQIFIIPSSECICTFGVFAHIKLPSLFWCLRIRMCRLASVTCTFILNDFLRQRRKRFCAFFLSLACFSPSYFVWNEFVHVVYRSIDSKIYSRTWKATYARSQAKKLSKKKSIYIKITRNKIKQQNTLNQMY